MAQSVEHVLGKDGVGSSNLPSSSKRKRTHYAFFFVIIQTTDCHPERNQGPIAVGTPQSECFAGEKERPSKRRHA